MGESGYSYLFQFYSWSQELIIVVWAQTFICFYFSFCVFFCIFFAFFFFVFFFTFDRQSFFDGDNLPDDRLFSLRNKTYMKYY